MVILKRRVRHTKNMGIHLIFFFLLDRIDIVGVL